MFVFAQRRYQMRDWDDIRFFLAVACGGNLSAAGRLLGVRHTTVLRRLDALESRLGLQLFERRSAGYTATAAGEEILTAARRVEDEILGMTRRLAGRDTPLSGTVRLSASDDLADALLPPILAGLRRRHPGIELELNVANGFIHLTRRAADIALRSGDQPSDTVVGRHIADIAFAVYGERKFVGSRPPLVRASDLIHENLLAPDDSLVHGSVVRWLRQVVPGSRGIYRSNSYAHLMIACSTGMGFAVLPCFLGDTVPDLVRALPPQQAMRSPLWLLTHPDLANTAAIRAVTEFLASAIMAKKILLEGHAMPAAAS